MRKTTLLLASLTLAALSSCSMFNKPTSKTTVPAPGKENSEVSIKASDAEIGVLAGEWSVVEINGHDLKINGDNRPLMTFSKSPDLPSTVNLICYNGCNYVNGAFKVSTGRLTKVGEFISSLMACPDAAYETEINQAIDKIAGYRAEGRDLLLTDASGRTIIRLQDHNMAFLNGAWKVTRIHNTTLPSTADVKIVIDTEQQSVHGNAGCNLLNGNVILNYDVEGGIEFRQLATTRMTCPDIETERQFLIALEEVAKAVKGTDPDTALLLDDKGNTVIALHRMTAAELAASL